MQVEPYDGPPDAWDRFVRGAEGWTHFHLYGWRSVIERTFGHECIYLVAREGGELAGVLPLVRVKSPLFGHFLVSMPFLNYGGPLGSPRAVAALTADASRRAREEGVSLLELRSRQPLEVDLPVSHRKITVVRDLFGDPERLWDDLRSKIRTRVRKPRKEGIEVRFGADQLPIFYEVWSRLMRDLGTPALPEAFFRHAHAVFGEAVWFGTAYLNGRALAAGCAIRWDDEVEMTWSASLLEHRSLGANMLLFWAFMERGAAEGLATFNFGRSTPESGTHDFKRQWGSRDERLWWYYRAEGGRERTPSPDDATYAWGPRIWRRLPVPLSRWLGPKIVRYIP